MAEEQAQQQGRGWRNWVDHPGQIPLAAAHEKSKPGRPV